MAAVTVYSSVQVVLLCLFCALSEGKVSTGAAGNHQAFLFLGIIPIQCSFPPTAGRLFQRLLNRSHRRKKRATSVVSLAVVLLQNKAGKRLCHLLLTQLLQQCRRRRSLDQYGALLAAGTFHHHRIESLSSQHRPLGGVDELHHRLAITSVVRSRRSHNEVVTCLCRLCASTSPAVVQLIGCHQGVFNS
ncbi:hypothetical protein TYRP_012281 [Tyrophagus putrescentiae]|nr:hypothetical protein TYRP_012281 [Tyrophagus putrescentiae]